MDRVETNKRPNADRPARPPIANPVHGELAFIWRSDSLLCFDARGIGIYSRPSWESGDAKSDFLRWRQCRPDTVLDNDPRHGMLRESTEPPAVTEDGFSMGGNDFDDAPGCGHDEASLAQPTMDLSPDEKATAGYKD